MQFDLFRNKTDPSHHLAAAAGAGLPSYFHPGDWELMPPGDYPIPDKAADEIAARGFCLFKMVDR